MTRLEPNIKINEITVSQDELKILITVKGISEQVSDAYFLGKGISDKISDIAVEKISEKYLLENTQSILAGINKDNIINAIILKSADRLAGR